MIIIVLSSYCIVIIKTTTEVKLMIKIKIFYFSLTKHWKRFIHNVILLVKAVRENKKLCFLCHVVKLIVKQNVC